MAAKITDAIIVGAGPAGLSAAIYMARYDRSCVIFDAGHGRSTHHQMNHNYLGFPGGVPAVKLRELGRAQLAEYPQIDWEHHKVVDCKRDGDEFVAEGQFGTVRARVVIICTGVLDHYPHFHGWEQYVGHSMFWCITCDGYSSKGKNILVIGHTNAAAGEAVQLSRFSNKLTLLTNSHVNEIDGKYQARLEKFGIEVIHDKIERAIGADGQFEAVLSEEGRHIPLDALFCTQGATPEVQLAVDLGVKLYENGYIDTDIEQRTNIPGVYAAGDVTRIHSHQITTAVHEGATAASAANYYLYPPELKAD
ncbi:MAG TPA: NAD(P)/FAD-dependent oxidoreductase [Acidimicrobiales bacterium]|jgi:thioredoxin reductase (NADPH)|nr:NAD(P)/FAD-dependent oxidoreductase [Acidimicrobiales bacterium]